MAFLPIVGGGKHSDGNSTTSVLVASATFTGTAEIVDLYNQVHITAYFEPNEVPNGDVTTAKASFYFEFSPDGTNWDISVPHVVRSGIFIPITAVVVDKYFRVRWENDGGASAITALGLSETAGTPTTQTAFRLNTRYFFSGTKELARTIDQSVSGSDPVVLNRSVVMGKNPDGEYVNIFSTGRNELYTIASESVINRRALYQEAGVNNTTSYALFIDLSDTTLFKHDSTNFITLSTMKMAIDRSSTNSIGAVSVGVITEITAVQAIISYAFYVPFQKGDTRRILSINNFSPSRLSMEVDTATWVGGTTNLSETTASVNSLTSIPCSTGVNTIPAVGDVILKFEESGSGNYDVVVEADYGSQ